MTNNAIKTAIATMALTVGLGVAHAQIGALPPPPPKPPAPGQPAPKLTPTEQWIKDVKNPAPWVSWGADVRVRNEYGDNLVSLTPNPALGGVQAPLHEQDFIRFRERVWVTLAPVKNFEFNTRVTAEPRQWMKPAFTSAYAQTPESGTWRGKTGWDWTEGIIDILNFKWKQVLGAPLTLTVGRQDILMGDFYDWWLVSDGTPLDGSRTFFLDAARVTLDLKEQKTTIDAMGIIQHARNDSWLPPLNGLEKFVTEQNESGAILYVSNKSIKKTQIDAYFIYKNDIAKVAPGGDSADIYTFGSKITGDITDHLRYSVEGAYQFGWKRYPLAAGPFPVVPSQDISAFGVKNRLTYSLKDELNNQFRFTHEFLSGDDPSTSGRNEGFDPLWGRWPRWSELYIYSMPAEARGRVAQISNLHRFGPGWTITPTKRMAFSLDYNALFSDERSRNAALDGGSAAFGGGNFRGHYVQAVLKYKFSQRLSGHLWNEFVFPGNFYADSKTFSFIRAELLFTF
ncbi:MAG: alginate export family protein [Verrucomicrobia bacterium]|nr:alginate export family protein [Verrucomicrobiota bacterium]